MIFRDVRIALSATVFAASIALAAPGLSAQERPAPSDRETAEGITFFESKIRPVLVEKCYKCHSAGSDSIKGNLRLDTRDVTRQGGDSGPAVVPFHPEQSVLFDALNYGDYEMPPDGQLPEAVIADFRKWIELGAPDPREGDVAPGKPIIDWESRGKHWSFQPVAEVKVPEIATATPADTEIDRFVLAKLAEKGLIPTAAANRETLVRRLYFDLWGLPPTDEQLRSFAESTDPRAYETLVDDLLASPHYGERWGRHWLDLARFADSTGGSTSALMRDAWKYRDYVIQSFNDDKPFDEFVSEQVAGDLLPASSLEERAENLTGTAFLLLGPRNYVIDEELTFRMDGIDEQVDTIGRAFLGMTIGCARCHDHKFDPVPTADYYALAGILDSTVTYSVIPGSKNFTWSSIGDPRQDPDGVRWAEYDRVASRLADIKEYVKEYGKTIAARKRGEVLDSGALGRDKPDEELQAEIKRLQEEEAILKPQLPKKPETLMAVAPAKQPDDMRMRVRGNPQKAGDVVPRGYLQAVSKTMSPPSVPLPIPRDECGRMQLARWLTAEDNPLTARVLVNRVWAHLLGRGIVSTVDNFGLTGEPPTHPELLDWLARNFRQDGQSIKRLVRQIVLSSTYRRGPADAQSDRKLLKQDPDNFLLGRRTPRSLDAESLRDAMLQISGKLDLTPGGSQIPEKIKEESQYVGVSFTRSVYVPRFRNQQLEMFSTFDAANPALAVGKRDQTVIPTQALYLLNSDFVTEQAKQAAERMLKAGSAGVDERIEAMYRRTLSRTPSEREVTIARGFLSDVEGAEPEEVARRWAALQQTLFECVDFRFIR